MYSLSKTSQQLDVAGMFDPDDFFNSSIIYTLPKVSTSEYVMSYLSREDLVSREFYGDSNQLGYILIYHGQTCHMEEGEMVRDDQPLKTIDLKVYGELRERLSRLINPNTLTDKALTSRSQEAVYEYAGGRFKLKDN